MIDRERLLASIRAGEDSELELAEVVFRGGRVTLGGRKGRAASELAEVFVSMANTGGGLVVFGVRDSDRAVVGIEPGRREAVERFAVDAAAENCEPAIFPGLDWEHLPGADGIERLCLVVRIPRSLHEVHRTNEGRYLERIGTHRRPGLPRSTLAAPDRAPDSRRRSKFGRPDRAGWTNSTADASSSTSGAASPTGLLPRTGPSGGPRRSSRTNSPR